MSNRSPSDTTDDVERLRAEITRLQADNARLRELLDVAQDFGRLGVWERDPNTLEGRWDRHVFRFFGFEEGATPHFDEAAARINPSDRLGATFLESLKVPGTHGHRYRVARPDGTVAHMHSQWRVIAGPDGLAARVIGVMVDDTDAHRLADEAATAHEQLALALDMSAIGLSRYDIATGRMHYDERAQAILGRPMGPDGVPVEAIRSWVHPDDRADVDAAFQKALAADGPVDAQSRRLHADGRWRVILTRGVLRRDAAGRPVALLGVLMDITDQQERTLEALRLARRLESAAEAARVGLWSGAMLDEQPEWNPLMYELLGHDPSEGPLRLGDGLRRYAHPDDRDRVAREVLAWAHGPLDATLDIESRAVRGGDGAVRTMAIRTRKEKGPDGVVRALGILLDVTEQREAIERLRVEHARVKLALSSVGMGTWSQEIATGHYDWDEQMFRLRGLEPGGPPLSATERMAMVLPEDRAHVASSTAGFSTSAEPLAFEFRIRRADGKVRTLASRSIGVVDGEGRLQRRIGVNWDVTETRLLERAQQEREMALRDSRTKTVLLSRMSHELRTPLNAILGMTQLMLADPEVGDAAQRRRRVMQMQTAGEDLLSLVDGVLELNALTDVPRSAAVRPLSLHPVVQRAVATAQSRLGAARVQLAAEDAVIDAMGDERALERALWQLLAHAASRNADRGVVRVELQCEGAEAVIAVHDAGPPIDDQRAQRLLEVFGDGAGSDARSTIGAIGLALAHAHALRMGGRVRLAHSGASDTRIELRLPLVAIAVETAPGWAATRVLYIEDNDVNMMIVRELLSQRPTIEFHGASDGHKGVAMARELQPALVLVDMQLPDIDGIEVLRRLRADPATAGLACVALSANAMPEDVRRARAAGFDDYWTKPIDLSAFLASIDRLAPTRGPA